MEESVRREYLQEIELSFDLLVEVLGRRCPPLFMYELTNLVEVTVKEINRLRKRLRLKNKELVTEKANCNRLLLLLEHETRRVKQDQQ